MPFRLTPRHNKAIEIRNAIILHDDATKMIQASHYPDGTWRVSIDEQPHYVVEYLVQNKDGSWDIKMSLAGPEDAKPVVRYEEEKEDRRIIYRDGEVDGELRWDCPNDRNCGGLTVTCTTSRIFSCSQCRGSWGVKAFRVAKLGEL